MRPKTDERPEIPALADIVTVCLEVQKVYPFGETEDGEGWRDETLIKMSTDDRGIRTVGKSQIVRIGKDWRV